MSLKLRHKRLWITPTKEKCRAMEHRVLMHIQVHTYRANRLHFQIP